MAVAAPTSPLRYGGDVLPGERGYAFGARMMAAWRAGKFGRSWWLGPRLVSAQATAAEGKGMWKAVERFPVADPDTLLPALEAVGVHHPASYADCYHQLAPRMERLPAVYNRQFERWPGGPWEEARQTGRLPGRWYRYDMRQAYRWASTLGLPDASTYRLRRRKVDGPGLWLFELTGPARSDLPPIFRGPAPLVVSTEDIETYKLVGRVWRGVTWERTLPADYVEATLQRLPCPKEAGRAYWGRWIARDPLVVKTDAKTWELKVNPFRHLIWGWLIVARVRARVWEASAGKAAHIYVDEVVLPEPLPDQGDFLGAWRPKAEYPNGVTIYRTGHFGPTDGPPAMQTGVIANVA